MSEVTFLPCPFCGCSDTELWGDDSDMTVQCCECLAEGPTATIGCRTEEDGEIDLEAEAIELWNRRTLGAVKSG